MFAFRRMKIKKGTKPMELEYMKVVDTVYGKSWVNMYEI